MVAPGSNRPAARWRRALGRSTLAVYGPYALIGPICVRDCGHCLALWAKLLPAAPGMLPVYLLGQAAGLRGWDERLGIGLAALVAALMAVGLAWVSRLGWKVQVASLVVAGLGSAVGAGMLAAAVRS